MADRVEGLARPHGGAPASRTPIPSTCGRMSGISPARRLDGSCPLPPKVPLWRRGDVFMCVRTSGESSTRIFLCPQFSISIFCIVFFDVVIFLPSLWGCTIEGASLHLGGGRTSRQLETHIPPPGKLACYCSQVGLPPCIRWPHGTCHAGFMFPRHFGFGKPTSTYHLAELAEWKFVIPLFMRRVGWYAYSKCVHTPTSSSDRFST